MSGLYGNRFIPENLEDQSLWTIWNNGWIF